MNFRLGAGAVRVPGLIVALSAAAWPALATASELTGSVTLATQYIYRGQALSDGNPAVQAGIDYAHDSGFFVGAWASTVDLPNPTGRRDAELDVYAGYHLDTGSPLSMTLSLTRYTYPGQSGFIDYDYTEALVVTTYDDRYSVEFGYTKDLYGFGVPGRHGELRADWPLRNAVVISAGVGYNDIEETGTSSYWYWDLGASARFSRITADLRWYDNEQPEGFLYGLSAGSQLVASLSFSF